MSNDQLVNKASALARLWATTQPPSRSQPAPTPLTRLAKSPDQVGSALWLIDRLTPASAPDVLVSALREAPSDGFSFLPPIARAALKTGQILAPHAAKPLAGSLQSSIRGVWSDLVINNDGEELTRHIASTLARGQRLNLAPVGGAAVTEAQAQAHIQQLMGML
ncbi:MAG TPA: hypothetical protein VK054_06950, partial [Beutenbergiaceae bacterium]|nr:hypothetical protein [Beutenbergiaceae bacterium]